MEKNEVKSLVKSIYLQAAALGGFEVNPGSPEILVGLVEEGYEKVSSDKRAEAAANIIDLISESLRVASERHKEVLDEESVDAAREKICPVYPFGR